MRTRVAFVGGGSFVFGPAMLSQAILENRSGHLDLTLIDPQKEVVELVAAFGQKMAERERVDVRVEGATDLLSGLDGADYVLCCAAVQLNRRFAIDREIVLRHDPTALITEFGGVAGISYTMRQCAFITSLARQMAERRPQAKLLNISNPLPRVCEAASRQGIETIGFCSVSVSGFGRLGSILEGTREDYPFTEGQRKYRVKMGGVNHLSWLLELVDKATEEDLMPALRDHLEGRKGRVVSKGEEWGRNTGYFPMSGDDHIQDFLPPEGMERSIRVSSHGSEADRLQRLELLRQVADGKVGFESIEIHPAWERPFDVIAALEGGSPLVVESLNLINRGQIPELPFGRFVETRGVVDSEGVRPEHTDLPKEVAAHCRLAATISGRMVDAFESRSWKILTEVIDLDPTIVDKISAKSALKECLGAHRDLIGSFS